MLRRLTIERTAEIILFMLLFALAVRVPLDTDVWWHLRSANYTLAQGFIWSDPFSHTAAGSPWINHSWLAQIILAGFWQVGAETGLAIYTALFATLGMYFVYRMSEGSVYLRALALVLGSATAAAFWSPRPQMLSFALSAAVLYLIWGYRSGRFDRLWIIPIIMAFWGNLHAGFSIGFIFLGGTLAGGLLSQLFAPQAPGGLSPAQWRKLLVITLISAAALLINPYGLQMLLVPFQTVGIGALTEYVNEWQSPNFQQVFTWPFIALLLGTLGVTGGSQRRLHWIDFVLVAGTAFMALLAGRQFAVFAVAATPVFATHLNSLLTERGWVMTPLKRVRPAMAIMNAVLIAIVGVGALAKIAGTLNPAFVRQLEQDSLPLNAVAYLRSSPPIGNLFNSYNWGGYLIYALPDQPVFIDGRTDLYGDRLFLPYYEAATGGENWRTILDQFEITTVVMEPNSGLARVLRSETGWRVIYEDQVAVLFERESS